MPDINWTDKKYQDQIAESWKKKPKQPKLYDMSFSKELCSKSIAPHPSWYRQMPILPILPRNLEAKKKEIKFSNEQQEGDLSASKLFCRSIVCTLHMLCSAVKISRFIGCTARVNWYHQHMHCIISTLHPPLNKQIVSFPLWEKKLSKVLWYMIVLFWKYLQMHFKN